MLLLVPAAAAAVVVLVRHHRRALLPVAVGGAVASLIMGIWAATSRPSGSWRWSEQLELGLRVEGLARVMVVLVPAIAIPVIAFAASSMRDDIGIARLLALLLVFVGAMLVLVAAADLVTLLLAWELVGALSWGLIAHDWRDPQRPQQAAHAFLTTRVGDLGLVAAAAITVATLGSARYSDLAALSGWQGGVVAGGVLIAACAKSAQLPFSPWLFSAMAGPSPVSALLHSATMVAAGAYVLARVVPLLPQVTWLSGVVAGIGLATALAGGLVATVQTDLKRALAASTSAQYGLIFVAVGAGSTAAAGAHLVTHAVFKALLFLGAGIVLHSASTLDLAGRWDRLVLRGATAVAVGVGFLALAAVPPLGGARSKESILAAAAHQSAWLAIGVIVAGFLSALYAGRLAVLTLAPVPPLAGDPNRPVEHADNHSRWVETAALVVLAAASVGLGAMWLPGAARVAEAATGGRFFDAERWELPASLVALATGAACVTVLHRASRLVTLGLSKHFCAAAAGWFGLSSLAKLLIVDPVLALSRGLSAIDDRVVDAGVRFTARIPRLVSRLLSFWGERSFDGAVHAVAGGALRAASGSRRFDDGAIDRGVRAVGQAGLDAATRSRVVDELGIDRAVEDVARGTGFIGTRSRRLQTGLAHHYYVIAVAGLAALVAIAVIGR